MHELYIAESILNSVKDVLPPDVTPERVLQVYVQVGQLDAVVTESLVFNFDAVKSIKGFANARLEIETIPVLCRCRNCSQEFTLDLPIFICPVCCAANVELLQGRGITLQRIEVEEI